MPAVLQPVVLILPQGLQLDTAGDGGREEAEEVATTEPVSEVAEEANKQALRELFHYDIVRKIDDGSYGEVFGRGIPGWKYVAHCCLFQFPICLM